jgi:hypothetical protein
MDLNGFSKVTEVRIGAAFRSCQIRTRVQYYCQSNVSSAGGLHFLP